MPAVFELSVKRFYWQVLSGSVLKRVKTVLARLLDYERYHLYEIELDMAWILQQGKGNPVSDWRFEWLSEDSGNLERYLEYRRDLSRESVIRLLRSGCSTVMAFEGGRIVGDCWLGVESFPFPDRKLASRFQWLGYAYSFKAYVEPRYRGRGIFPLLKEEQIKTLRGSGKKFLFGAVSPSNTSSRRSFEKTGFTHGHTLHMFRLMGKWHALLTGKRS